jgi:hypothetical protein
VHTRTRTALTLSYEDQERLVWEQLSGLVTDAAWLESYAAATMVKVKEALQVRPGEGGTQTGVLTHRLRP